MYIKDQLNKTIDSSKDEKELVANLHGLASKYLGKERADLILDSADNFKDSAEILSRSILNFNEKDAEKAVAQEMYKKTPEAEYLQPIYDVADPVLKGLSVIGKPVSASMALGRTIGKIGNAAINAINPEYGEPLEEGELPIIEEAQSIFPTPAGAFTADLRENYPQEGFLEGVIPEGMKQRFPKLSSAVEGIGPYDVAEMAVASKLPSAIKAGAAGSAIASEAGTFENVKKALVRMSDGLSEPNRLRMNKNLDRIADRVINEPELLKRIGKPREMEKYLLGDEIGARGRYGGYTTIPKSIGAIEEAAEELKNALKNYEGIPPIDAVTIRDKIARDVHRRLESLGSGDIGSYKLKDVKKAVDRFMDTGKKPSYTLDDIVNVKKNVSKKLFDLGQSTYDPSSPSALKHMIAEELWEDLNRQIRKVAKKTNDTRITDANARFSDLASIRDIMGKTVTAEMAAPSLKESLIGGTALAGGAMAAGMSPWQASLIGGIYPVGRAVERTMANKYPSYAARASQFAQKGYGLMSKIPNQPLALALASYEIPRNSKKILEEADIVLAKLAQNTTTPEGQVLFDAVHDAIKNNPNKVPMLMKTLSEQIPGVFQYSESNSFDNIVPESMRKNVLKKINNSKQLSNSQKAKKIQLLINEGYYDEFAKD